MTVSTTATFSLDLDDILDLAFRRVGSKTPAGYDISAGRKALALLFYTLTVRNVCLWQIEKATALALTADDADVTLDADTVDVLEMTVADTSQSTPIELPLERMPRDAYHALPNKALSGPPTHVYVHRGRDAPTLYLYPVPDDGDYELRYWRIVKPRDPGALTNGPDAPVKWMPAIVSGLAWFLARDNPAVPLDLRRELAAEWEKEFIEAASEDRDSSSIEIVADLSHVNRPFG